MKRTREDNDVNTPKGGTNKASKPTISRYQLLTALREQRMPSKRAATVGSRAGDAVAACKQWQRRASQHKRLHSGLGLVMTSADTIVIDSAAYYLP